MYSFYLNGTLLGTEPIGWDKYAIEIQKNLDYRYYIIRYTGDLNFSGDAYDIIKQAVRDGGRDQILPFTVYKTTQGGKQILWVDGSINFTEGKDIVYKRLWETPVRDNNYSSKLFNSIDQKVALFSDGSPLTKNGSALTPVVSRTFGSTGLVDDNGQSPFYYNGVLIDEAFEYLISFLSDNTLSFSSTWYDNLGYNISIYGVDGAYIDANRPVTTSLGDLIKSVARLYNLYVTVEGSTVRLEEESYFKGADASITLSKTPRYEVLFDETTVYKEIKIGDKIAGDSVSTHANKDSDYLPTVCYMDSNATSSASLDLQPEYIINSGVVQQIRNNSFAGIGKAVLEQLSNYYERPIQEEFYKDYSPNNWYDETYRDQIFLLEQGTLSASGGQTNTNFANDQVLARYDFVKDVYYEYTDRSSFTISATEGCIAPILADNTEKDIPFTNLKGENAFVKKGDALTGGGSSYFHSGASETKRFSITVKIPKYYAANDDDLYTSMALGRRMFQANDKQYEVTATYALAGSSTTFFTDKNSNWDAGDRVKWESNTDSSNDWDIGSGNKQITNVPGNANVVVVNLNSSSYTDEFIGGTLKFRHPDGSGGYDLTTYKEFEKLDWGSGNSLYITLGIKHVSSGGTRLDDVEIVDTTANSDVSYTCEAEFTVSNGDFVAPYIKLSKGGSATTDSILITPIEWKDFTYTPKKAVSASTTTFTGDIVEFEYPLSETDIESIILAPYKAVEMPEGKAWIKSLSINAKTGLAKFSLQTNSTYFNAGT